MSAPRTKAGMVLLDGWKDGRYPSDITGSWQLEQDVLAIEADASALDVERLTRAIYEDDDHSLGGVDAYRAEAIRIAAAYKAAR